MSEYTKQLKAERRDKVARMSAIVGNGEQRLTPAQRNEFDDLKNAVDHIDNQMFRANDDMLYAPPMGTDGRPIMTTRAIDGIKSGKHNDRIEGRLGETLDSKQTMTEWVRRAAQNGISCETDPGVTGRGAGHGRMVKLTNPDNFNMDAYWAQRFGLRKPGAELRTLTEDTSGSAQAITPQAWTGTVIDYVYPNTVLGKLGATVVPMPTEQYNIGQFTAPVQPQYVAEAGSTSLDANPAFSPVPLIAKGAFYDITLYTIEALQDVLISGGLSDFLAKSAARNYQIAVDNAGFYGVTSNAGCVGFSNTTGIQLRKWGAGGASSNTAHTGTTGQAPADTQEPSTMVELVRAKNIEPTGFATSPQLVGTLARINASSYAKFWDMPVDVADLWTNHTVYSTTIPVVETDPASGTIPAESGGTMTSLYCADWSRVYIGMHLDMQTVTLNERYADQLEVGLLTYMRFCVVLTHPEGMVRSYGALTT